MRLRDGLVLGVGLLLAACASRAPEKPGQPEAGAASLPQGVYKLGKPYKIAGRWYHPAYEPDYDRTGVASWYGAAFHGKPTANGEVFDKELISAAHPTLPLPSIVRVTNLENGRSLELRVNDRGPFVGDRMIDLSQAAARELGYEGAGLARVRVQFVGLADDALGTPPSPSPATVPETTMVAQVPAPARRAPAPEREAEVQLASLADVAPTRSRPAAATRPACGPGPHFVQVGAFSEGAKVRAATARLEDVAPVSVEPVFIGSAAAARVRLGPLGPREAERVLAQVRGRGYTDAFLASAGRSADAPSCSDT
ncbi:septal ring lytic transglycosylase RlpA family protein [Marinimicrococcus flavescens]|uniref:Endolytic peptidoglycan transglycosylase RlpA n=1 Tax=Marinimicrococcus flavescens TaxID=3031815 RepID=A0AAP3UYG2_9PROT|nr:septal ring lytic transglycosylase RlpA family protein [Marinimicrococcus flavescens]